MNNLEFDYSDIYPLLNPQENAELGLPLISGPEITYPLESRATFQPSLASIPPSNEKTDFDLLIEQTRDWKISSYFIVNSKAPMYQLFYKEADHKTTIHKWISLLTHNVNRQAADNKHWDVVFNDAYEEITPMIVNQSENKNFIHSNNKQPIIKIKIDEISIEWFANTFTNNNFNAPTNTFIIPFEYNKIFFEFFLLSRMCTSDLIGNEYYKGNDYLKKQSKERLALLYNEMCKIALMQRAQTEASLNLEITDAASERTSEKAQNDLPKPTNEKEEYVPLVIDPQDELAMDFAFRTAFERSLASISPPNAKTEFDLMIEQSHDWKKRYVLSNRSRMDLFTFFYKENEHKDIIDLWARTIKSFKRQFKYLQKNKSFTSIFADQYNSKAKRLQNRTDSKNNQFLHKKNNEPILKIQIHDYVIRYFKSLDQTIEIIVPKNEFVIPVDCNKDFFELLFFSWVCIPPIRYNIPYEKPYEEEAGKRLTEIYKRICEIGLKQQRQIEPSISSELANKKANNLPKPTNEKEEYVPLVNIDPQDELAIFRDGINDSAIMQQIIDSLDRIKQYPSEAPSINPTGEIAYDISVAGSPSERVETVRDDLRQLSNKPPSTKEDPELTLESAVPKLHVANVPLAYLDVAKAPELPVSSSDARDDQIEKYVRLTFTFLKDTQPVDYKTTQLEEGSMRGLLLSPQEHVEARLPLTAIVAARGENALIPDDDNAPVLIVTTENEQTAKQWVGKNRQVLIIQSFFDFPPEHLSLPSTRRAMAMWAVKCLGKDHVLILDDNVEKWCLKADRNVSWAELLQIFRELAEKHETAILGATEHTRKEWNRNRTRLTSDQMKADLRRTGAKAHFINIPKLLRCVQGNWQELIPPLPDLPQGDQLLYFIAHAAQRSVGKISSESLLFIRTDKTPRLAPAVLKKAEGWTTLDVSAYSASYQAACVKIKNQVLASLEHVQKENNIVIQADLNDHRPQFKDVSLEDLIKKSASARPHAPSQTRPVLPNFDHTQLQVELTANEALNVLRQSLTDARQHIKREYQQEIFKKIEEKYQHRMFHVTMATGLGKSEMMSCLSIEAFKNFNGKWNVVVITRNLDQTNQAYERICKFANSTIPVLPVGSNGLNWKLVAINEKANTEGQIIVGCQHSIEILNNEHPHFLKRTGLFLMDETHKIHQTLFDKIMEIARDRAIIAFSATPGERAEQFCEIKGMDALEGMKAGYLAPWFTHQLSWDDFYIDGQLNETRLTQFLGDHPSLMEHHLLIVVPAISDAERMTNAINQIYDNKAISITAKSLQGIEKILQTMDHGPKIGIVVHKLLVGFDSIYIRNILILKQMDTDAATQALGRVLRKDPNDNGKVAGFWMTEKVDLRRDYLNPSASAKRRREETAQKQARPSIENTRKHKRDEIEPVQSQKRPRPAQVATTTYIKKAECFSIPVQDKTTLAETVQLASRLAAAYRDPLHKTEIAKFGESVLSIQTMRDLQKNGWQKIKHIIDSYPTQSTAYRIYEYDRLGEKYDQKEQQNTPGEEVVHIRRLPDNKYHVLLKKR